jgi:glycosyltransferase involved in cell wall biosynthesis
VLLLGHVVGLPAAARRARTLWPAARLDTLAYGRGPDDAPIPDTTPVAAGLGAGGAGATLRTGLSLLWRLRRTRYDAVAIVQPNLAISRSRGAILGFAGLVGAPLTVALDPDGKGVSRPIGRATAGVDLLRFLILRTLAALLAAGAARAIRRLGRLRPGDLPGGGTVVYLRTDLDLVLAPLRAGGSLAHTDGILRALARRGHRVEFWATGELAPLPADVIERRLAHVLRANLPWEIAELLSGLAAAARASRRPSDVAFLYQRYSLNNLTGYLLARRWRVPLVLEANASEAQWRADWSVLEFPALAHAAERLLLESAARVATVSENAARGLRAAGAPPQTLRVVPNGVEVARFGKAVPAELPFPGGSFVVCFSGLFYPWHGVRVLARAFPLLLDQCPDARLLLVGDGEDAGLVRSILADAGALEATHMTGLVGRDEVPGYLAAADVLVTPHARNEDFVGSPIKLFEYLASGRAVVASRVAQLATVVRDGENGLVVEPDDPDALAGALARLHDDPELRARLGAAAAADARAHHSWDARLGETLAPVS